MLDVPWTSWVAVVLVAKFYRGLPPVVADVVWDISIKQITGYLLIKTCFILLILCYNVEPLYGSTNWAFLLLCQDVDKRSVLGIFKWTDNQDSRDSFKYSQPSFSTFLSYTSFRVMSYLIITSSSIIRYRLSDRFS